MENEPQEQKKMTIRDKLTSNLKSFNQFDKFEFPFQAILGENKEEQKKVCLSHQKGKKQC